jgi:hypothetical protein
MVRYNPRSLLVYYNERVVGELVRVHGGWAYHHFKFGLGISSAIPNIDDLMLRVEEYLQKSLA